MSSTLMFVTIPVDPSYYTKHKRMIECKLETCCILTCKRRVPEIPIASTDRFQHRVGFWGLGQL
jgi:hypothetical protein